jgi:hypothetical protein
MFNFFEYTPWYFAAFVIIFGSAFLSIIVLFILRSLINTKRLKDHHDVAGFTFGIVGVMYAVLLSYMVVDVHDRYNEIHQNIDLEANLVAELYRDAEVFPENIRKNIKHFVRQYIEITTKDGFEFDISGTMNSGIHETISGLWKVYYSFEPVTERDKVWYAESIRKLNDFNRVRLLRLFNNNESIGTMMWTMLIVGACITVSFMYFFRIENVWFQALMTGLLSGFIGLMLFLIASLDTAFVGDIHVSPVHFMEVSEFLDRWDREGAKI